MYGIGLLDLSNELLLQILAIYNNVVGGRRYDKYLPQCMAEIHDILRHGDMVEWKLGSKVSGYSKLQIIKAVVLHREWIMVFRFAPNLDKHRPPRKIPDPEKVALQLGKEFETAVDDFLKNNDGILLDTEGGAG